MREARLTELIRRSSLARGSLIALALFGALALCQQLILGVGQRLAGLHRVFWMVSAEAIYIGLMLWLYRSLVKFAERRSPSELREHVFRQLMFGTLFGVALFSVVFALLVLGGSLRSLQEAASKAVWITLATSCASGVGEELLFRGAIFRITADRLGTSAALIVSSALFGFAHIANPGATLTSTIAIALEAGVLLGLIYTLTRSLWAPIGWHLGWNFAEGGLYGTPVSGTMPAGLWHSTLTGPTWMTGGGFGPEASLPALLVCGVSALALGVWSYRHGRWQRWNGQGRRLPIF